MVGWYTLFALGLRADGGFCMSRDSAPAELGTFRKVFGGHFGVFCYVKDTTVDISRRGKVEYCFIIKLC